MAVKPKTKTVFVCASCGADTPKWEGRCPACGQWNTLAEKKEAAASRPPRRMTDFSSAVEPLTGPSPESVRRLFTGIGEFDRILGGGLCPGSLVLLGGAPGIGKSTLMLQVAHRLARPEFPVLYVSGEESPAQVKGRAARLGVKNESLFLLSETDLVKIVAAVDAVKPGALVVDSVQTVHHPDVSGAPGAVGQIRECAAELLHMAKGRGLSVFLLGHVTKEGDLAGPRVLEHMVDTVLYFETERQDVHRILRAVKNRFGPTNEIGVFEMTGRGLVAVENPSELFLGIRGAATPAGTAVMATLEGTRPLLVEVQALTSRTLFGMPRRQMAGVDYNRTLLLVAVLEKRCGLALDGQDVYVNVTGGLEVKEPGADLAIAAAVASAFLDRPTPRGTLWLGEVGLGGELRPVFQTAERLAEAAKMGFDRAIVPRSPGRAPEVPTGMAVRFVETLSEALKQGHLLVGE